ncbi:MAG TPA: ankyrin repeat domain-containing protein, partial [Longimicrobiales bacterium]|nr:ankyrin repeat domain-containing protein [Longimicrobiales bacterium]
MSRKLTSQSRVENLKKEAKRWLKALRANDAAARTRLTQILPNAPAVPGLRDVQLALAREYGFPGWAALTSELERIRLGSSAPRDVSIAALLAAAERGDADRVAEVLDQYPDIIDECAELEGHTGKRTALHFGIRHEQVVKALLERGANPNIRDDGDDAMPLHFAAERGDLNIVRLLIEHGADPVGEGTFHELNALGWAVGWDYAQNTEVAEYLLAHGAQHTIHTAVALADVQAIRELVAQSPDDLERPMDRTNRRRRPLHLAVVKKQPAALAVLLQLGADPDAVDAAGLTPLDVAALNGETEMVRLLLEHGAAITLPAAIALERTADIDRLLSAEPEALKPGNRYGTLIVRASEHGSADIIKRLLRAGASVNARDDTETAIDQTAGYTPLHAAAWSANTAAVTVLLAHGADPNLRETKYGATPAGWAAYAGREEACQLILERDIDLFQAIDFDLAHRIPAIIERSPWLLNRT